MLERREQGVDQLVLGRVVVVQIARADAHLGRDQRGADIGLTEAVEQVERDFEDALGSAAWLLALRLGR